MKEEERKKLLKKFENINFLTDEEIEKANFFELSLYLQNLNIIDSTIKSIEEKKVTDNE